MALYVLDHTVEVQTKVQTNSSRENSDRHNSIEQHGKTLSLMASSPSSLQTQLTCLADFAGAEHLRVSKEKTLVLLENCTGKVQLEATELHEVTESKYLGII